MKKPSKAPASQPKLPPPRSAPPLPPKLPFSGKSFFLNDLGKTLFPLRTNKVLGEAAFEKFVEYAKSNSDHFLPQKRVFAMKQGGHLRRTFKLDPVAEMFLYDLLYRNRRFFRRPTDKKRETFGYNFEAGEPTEATLSYRGFKGATSQYRKTYTHSISFDVASYFNSIYHHDLVHWFERIGASSEDVSALGSFLREISSGRSIDCLPQGLYPAKMMGNAFLEFVQQSGRLQSDVLIRFMDDFVLFANDKETLLSDFYHVQEALSAKGLSVNPSKTRLFLKGDDEIDRTLDGVKKGLLRKRRRVVRRGYDEDEGDVDEELRNLTKKETDLLRELLARPHLEEEDAELVLALMGNHSADVVARFEDLLRDFPHLAKSIYQFTKFVRDKASLSAIIAKFVAESKIIPEFQLFWLGVILEESLLATKQASDIAHSLYTHPWATPITKAKVLEIADQRFGLTELRETHLKDGTSDWLAWASACGSRVEKRAARNYSLKYFKNASPINKLIGEVIADLPQQ
ncbi:antiviral reverse transcriptase Drt5 [Bradyrhizobium sp. DASA03007]|uniref:antiviral reverse transcriptase Drt5 n=1 Tax=unclassified Bradyrhizobium TaxID=2631580 RepID=UPI003F708564